MNEVQAVVGSSHAQNTIARVPLVAHIIHRLAVGGLENGLVNLINHMPQNSYRHVIICMTEYTDFRLRIERQGVECYALHKRAGQDFLVYLRLWRLLHRLRPDIVHTRNIGTLECQVPAMLSGVSARVHGEHGRDMVDLHGDNRKYIFLRKLCRPFITRYVALSRDLECWLQDTIGIKKEKIVQLYNGVDTMRFYPSTNKRLLPDVGANSKGKIVIGTVGMLRGEKDQMTLVRAFIRLIDKIADVRNRIFLVIIGDGPQRRVIAQAVNGAGIGDVVWLAGSREDIPELFRSMDLFVLPSLAEGISNTILEAMASGLPVVATRVGGNPELVVEGETGFLVPAADPPALAGVIQKYIDDPATMHRHGKAGRKRVEQRFSMDGMVQRYLGVYDQVLRSQPNCRAY